MSESLSPCRPDPVERLVWIQSHLVALIADVAVSDEPAISVAAALGVSQSDVATIRRLFSDDQARRISLRASEWAAEYVSSAIRHAVKVMSVADQGASVAPVYRFKPG